MLTPENIVALFASALSASRLLIFATSRQKRILNPFSRSSANLAYLIGIKQMAANYVVDRRSTWGAKKRASRLRCSFFVFGAQNDNSTFMSKNFS